MNKKAAFNDLENAKLRPLRGRGEPNELSARLRVPKLS